jgi:uncharacterized small protein (DUF1192 family)
MGIVLVIACIAPNASAQATGDGAAQSWQKLLEKQVPAVAKRAVRSTPRSPEEKAQERTELLAHYTALADDAKLFRATYPDDANARLAKALEAKSLLKLAFLGDTSRSARADVLVNEIEKDTAIPVQVRFEVVALAERILLRETAKNPREAQQAHESSARYLIKEFPAEAGGHLTLLSAADASSDKARVWAIAQEIEQSSAPFVAKGAARVAANRYALIGKSLANVANTALGRGNFFESTRNRRTVLYTWASWSPNSIAFAKTLAKLPDDVLVIGYNLDRDVDAAKRTAKTEKLPGEHYFDGNGIGSRLALLLSINAAPLAYVTDDTGVIVEVSAQRRDLVALLTGKKEG